MKTLKEASLADLQTQYQQIVSRIAEAQKTIETSLKKIELLEKERHYFLGILEYLGTREAVKVEEIKAQVPPPVAPVPEKKSEGIA